MFYYDEKDSGWFFLIIVLCIMYDFICMYNLCPSHSAPNPKPIHKIVLS